ncbi:hypothetical protein [Paenibacillus sp. SI8]|uniref:hypothetical protein n=1 Tax=unclassified Paenibacillus TaxID=185978 RepID=UPI0034664B08
MGTRLLSEQRIKDRFPQIRYIRIHTHGKYSATIYAWNENLQLPDAEMRSIRQFASDYLQPYICFQVKAYNMIQADNVPQIRELPEAIKKTALSRNLNQHGITAAINRLFPLGRLSFEGYDASNGIIHFVFHAITVIDHKDKERIIHYASEMIPIGSSCDVTFM